MFFWKRRTNNATKQAPAPMAAPIQLAGLVHFLVRRHLSDEGWTLTTPAMSADLVTYNKGAVEFRPGDRLYVKFVVGAHVIEVRARVPVPGEVTVSGSRLPCLVLTDVGEREKRLLGNLIDRYARHIA
jgi:hypothetical protein